MKKIMAGLVLMLAANAAYAIEYTCKAYTDGEQVGEEMKVNASKKIVAETKAKHRFKKEGHPDIDIIRCSE